MLALTGFLAGASESQAQPVSNPRKAEFVASVDHFATFPDGAPILVRYELQLYMSGATAPFHTVDLGKPAPQADGVISYDFSTGVVSWPLPGGTYEARVAAVGPNSTHSSAPSNLFTFGPEACTFSLSPATASVPPSGGASQLALTTGSGCAWAVAPGATWLTASPASGGESATLTVTAAANASTLARSATLTVGGQAMTFTQAGASPTDLDSDGLPDAWESLVGLQPDSAIGGNGAAGDPDKDGATNLQEFEAGTHPRGFARNTRYFAEGAGAPFFDTRFALLNPGSADARVLLQFLDEAGQVTKGHLIVPARSQETIEPGQFAGLPAAAYSTVVESDVEVVVDRTVSWDQGRYGAHSESAVSKPDRRWLFAEGATHSDFDLFLLLQNPNASKTADIRVRYLRPSGLPLVKSYAVGPRSRLQIWVNYETWPDGSTPLANTDVSMEVEVVSGASIVAERAMYRTSSGGPLFGAGHASAGVPAPALSWVLGEGNTGQSFEEFILIANPDPVATATVTMTYLLADARVFSKTIDVAPSSRRSVWVDREQFDGTSGRPLASTSLSAMVESTNGIPIVVERSMWWPGSTMATWAEAHNSPGATRTGRTWAAAGGEVSGAPANVDTQVLIANVSTTAGDVRVTLLFEGGGEASTRVATKPRSRTTVDIRSVFPEAIGRRFGVLVESLGTSPAQLVVERSSYWDALGLRRAAGTNSRAVVLR